MAEGLSKAQQFVDNKAVHYGGRFDKQPQGPLARPPEQAEAPDYSQPALGEDAGSKDVINLQQRRYLKKVQEGKVGEFGEIIEKDDLRDKELAEARGERKPLRGRPVDVSPETSRIEKIKRDNTIAEIRQAIAGHQDAISRIDDLGVLVNYLKDLNAWIKQNNDLSPQNRKAFRLSDDSQLTLYDLTRKLAADKQKIDAGAMPSAALAVLPFSVPDVYGFQQAVINIVKKMGVK